MDMYLTGKQTMPIETLKTLVSLYLSTLKAENDLLSSFWSPAMIGERAECRAMCEYIQYKLGDYL